MPADLYDGENKIIHASGSDTQGNNWWWAFIVLVVFALLLMWRKDGNEHRNNYGMDGMVAPLLAAQCANGGGYTRAAAGISHEIWDTHRDMMSQFNQMGRESDRYFYEQQKTSLLGFKDVEIEGMKNTARIESRIDALERTFKEDTIRQQDNKINTLETIIGIRGLGLVPAYNPPYNPHFAGCGHQG